MYVHICCVKTGKIGGNCISSLQQTLPHYFDNSHDVFIVGQNGHESTEEWENLEWSAALVVGQMDVCSLPQQKS